MSLTHSLTLKHDAQMDYYGKRIATCSSDKLVKIFNVDEGSGNQSLVATLQSHEGTWFNILPISYLYLNHILHISYLSYLYLYLRSGLAGRLVASKIRKLAGVVLLRLESLHLERGRQGEMGENQGTRLAFCIRYVFGSARKYQNTNLDLVIFASKPNPGHRLAILVLPQILFTDLLTLAYSQCNRMGSSRIRPYSSMCLFGRQTLHPHLPTRRLLGPRHPTCTFNRRQYRVLGTPSQTAISYPSRCLP